MGEKGFTLIELLVVISIISILAVMGLSMTGNVRKQARDTNRKSDLKQYQTSLENFANNNNGLYPARTGAVNASTTLCNDLSLTNCPQDPKGNQFGFGYYYRSDGSTWFTATKYVLWGKLENIDRNWVVCSNGKSGTLKILDYYGGNCPL